jgi:hypothetical protein
VLARIIKYYNATLTSPSQVVDDIRRAAIKTFGDGSLLTTRLAKFDPENSNFPPDPSERADLLEALFVQWDSEQGGAAGREAGLPGLGANSQEAGNFAYDLQPTPTMPLHCGKPRRRTSPAAAQMTAVAPSSARPSPPAPAAELVPQAPTFDPGV